MQVLNCVHLPHAVGSVNHPEIFWGRFVRRLTMAVIFLTSGCRTAEPKLGCIEGNSAISQGGAMTSRAHDDLSRRYTQSRSMTHRQKSKK